MPPIAGRTLESHRDRIWALRLWAFGLTGASSMNSVHENSDYRGSGPSSWPLVSLAEGA